MLTETLIFCENMIDKLLFQIQIQKVKQQSLIFSRYIIRMFKI